MKTAQADIQFPVIGFTPDGDLWGFPNRNALTESGPRTVKERTPVGMELVDADGRRWVVRDMWRLGRDKPLLPWLFWTLMTATPGSRIDYELEPLAPLSLPEVKARMKAGIEVHPLNWCNPSEVETEIPARLAEVDAAESIAGLFEVLGLDWFAAY